MWGQETAEAGIQVSYAAVWAHVSVLGPELAQEQAGLWEKP